MMAPEPVSSPATLAGQAGSRGQPTVQRVDRIRAEATIALLHRLRVSLLGIHSRRLHSVLVTDGVGGRIDCRIACQAEQVAGVVLAAPASYWRWLVLGHWGIAFECVRARSRARGGSPKAAPRLSQDALALLENEPAPRTWKAPGDAWRIIFVGTAPEARGKGIAAQLYRSIMADRSLVARIALDNTASIRLHHSVGWQLFRDGDVALAVHLRRSGQQVAEKGTT
jgi:GNAT superfamily N-acetyltransferase